MKPIEIWIVSALYGSIAVRLALNNDYGQALMFTGYLIANFGLLIWMTK